MPNNQFINLEELSVTTQALLSKINEQSNLKVNKHNVSAEYTEGTKIAEIEDIEIYAPIQEIDTSNLVTQSQLSNVMIKNNDYVTAGQTNLDQLGYQATAEGTSNNASGEYSHAEGRLVVASAPGSHAEGQQTVASATSAHAEGWNTTASGAYSHAEGFNTIASATGAHAEGYYTTAQRRSQHVFGEFNILDTTGTTASKGTYIEIVGKGTSTSARSNARTLDWNGNEVLAGKLTIGTAPTANMDVTTKQYVDNAVNGVTIPVTSVNGATGAVTLNYVPKVTTGTDRIVSISTGATGDNEYPGIGVSDDFGTSNIRFYDGVASIRNVGYDSQHSYNHEIRMSYPEGGLLLSSYVDDIDTNPTEWAGITIGPGNISISSGATQSVGIYDLIDPTTAYQAAHKKYVDDKFSAITYPVTSVNGATGAITITATGIGALPDSTVIPTKTSDLTNDSNYLSESGTINDTVGGYILAKGQYSSSANLGKTLYANASGEVQYLQIGRSHSSEGFQGAIKLSNMVSPNDYTTIKPSATTGVTITLPNATGTLALTSQIAVLSVNETTGNVIVDKIKTTTENYNTEYNLIGTTTSNNSTSAVSIYKQNLLSFARTVYLSRLRIGSTTVPGVIRIYTSADSSSGFTDIKSNASSTNERTITLPDASGTVALTTDIPSVPSWAMASSKPSYTFSELTSHPTTLNDYGITDAYTKTEVDGLVSGVLHYKGAKSTTGALPSSGNITGDVWHVTADGSEWAWDGSAWQELGTTVDLSGYLQTGDIAAWAKAANKPSYTASEVGALPSSTSYVSSFNGATGAITYTPPVTSVNGNTGAVTITAASITAASATHAHGNLTSGGDITTTATIASGDRLIINDESASKITNSSITFGSSTAQYLANNGTWQNVPTSYDDTALAARVTALEQIPWVTYYTGSTTPSNSQGNNGDLYFQTAQ